MAELGNNNNTASSRFSLFVNRSLNALHSINNKEKPSNLERAGSIRGRVVQKLCSFFESAKLASSEEALSPNKLKTTKSIDNSDSSEEALFPNKPNSTKLFDSGVILPGTEDRIVLYFTSLRGVRRTYEDCYAVRTIFSGFRVWVDERDVSMDSCYKKELMSVLGEKNKNRNNNVALPQVFIRGIHVGGADVIKHLCEVGELGKILEGFPKTKAGFVCETCGDVRFVPCGNCSGSRKVFDEDEGLMKRCLGCNENGLIRCPNCCSS